MSDTRVVWSGALEARGEAAGLSGYSGPSSLTAAIDQVPAGGDRDLFVTQAEARGIKSGRGGGWREKREMRQGARGGWRSGDLAIVTIEGD